MNSSIRGRLIRAFISVAIVPLLLVGVVLALLSFYVQREQALSRERTVAISVSGQVNDFFRRLEGELRVITKDLQGSNDTNNEAILSRLPSFPDTFQSVVLLDDSGQELAHLDRLKVITLADRRDWSKDNEFILPKTSQKIYYGPVTISKQTGEPSITISVPIIEPRTGLVSQVLTTSVRFKPVWDLIASIPVDSGEQIYIVSETGRVVAHGNPSVTLIEPNYTPQNELGIYPGLNGNSAVVAVRPLSFGDPKVANSVRVFKIVAEKDLTAALFLAIQTVVVTIVLLIVALALATMQGFFAARPIVSPIRDLAAAAEAIRVKAEGFDPRSLEHVMSRTDELGQLARVFENMGSVVKIREQDLKQQVQQLRVEIDQAKKEKQVAEITETEMFRDLQDKAKRMRARGKAPFIPDTPPVGAEPPATAEAAPVPPTPPVEEKTT